MGRKSRRNSINQSWFVDQLAKSVFFHRKLHEWGLLEIAQQIEQIHGEQYNWKNLEDLNISESAWNKVIHNGIKPVLVFAHPEVLQKIERAVSYYRMLAMVSQKSMARIGLPVQELEISKTPDPDRAINIARHLNAIISKLIESDETVMLREFDIWRGMAAGAQAQGSWQNAKGKEIETLVKEIIQQRFRSAGITKTLTANTIELIDGRTVILGDDPDIAIYDRNTPVAAIEVKGGIDPAGALERLGAAIKTLQRVKTRNPACTTILLIRQAPVTEGAKEDIERSHDIVNYWYTVEEFVENDEVQQQIWRLLGI